jgi:hypothetical protein
MKVTEVKIGEKVLELVAEEGEYKLLKGDELIFSAQGTHQIENFVVSLFKFEGAEYNLPYMWAFDSVERALKRM